MVPIKIGILLKIASKLSVLNQGKFKFLIVFLFSFIRLIINVSFSAFHQILYVVQDVDILEKRVKCWYNEKVLYN